MFNTKRFKLSFRMRPQSLLLNFKNWIDFARKDLLTNTQLKLFRSYERLARTSRFAHLDEMHEGLRNSTLDVSAPGSAELVDTLFNELLPNSTSDLVNISFDEPFELGEGKNKEWAEREVLIK